MAEIHNENLAVSRRRTVPGLTVLNEGQVHLKDLDPKEGELISKVQNVAAASLSAPASHETGPALEGRISPIAQNIDASRVEELSDLKTELTDIQGRLTTEKSPVFSFPNAALEATLLGLAKEKWVDGRVKGHIQKAREHQKNIDLLLDLSAKLSTLKGEKNELSEETKNLFNQLKEKGIDLLKNDDKQLSKERVSELKSLSSAQVDKLRSTLQILTSTEIQPLLQQMSAILEAVKGIINSNTRLLSAINSKMSGR